MNASMILFGLLFEHYKEPDSPNWMSFFFGSLTGIVSRLAIGVYIWSPGSIAEPPGFVYAIFAITFLFFNSFAINQVLQYKKIGPWCDHIFGESVYVFLSLSTKSLLAWLVFANALMSTWGKRRRAAAASCQRA
ncbi:MAG: heliorhodopsin HeR [Actinomycetota bacterium]|nr:heliorhodopsin HeR [Actinomycetota bacterium]